MLDISKTEKEVLSNYFDIDDYIKKDDLSALLIRFDDVITSLGFDENYELTKEGTKLQNIYDNIYSRNKK